MLQLLDLSTDQARQTLVILSYLPIALYAETFRVQKALIEAIILPRSVSPGLTGSIRDVEWLRNVSGKTLLHDHFEKIVNPSVTSLRHGSSFPLANGALLRALGLVGRRLDKSLHPAIPHTAEIYRETVLNLYIITPKRLQILNDNVSHSKWPTLVVGYSLFFTELIIVAGTAIFFYFSELWVGIVLMSCIFVNIVVLKTIQNFIRPIFGNQIQVENDMRVGVAGGAVLDVHVITENWNSSELDVYCGFSSHLHALTNIPVGIRHPSLLKYSCWILLAALITQAAILAGNMGSNRKDVLSSPIWLGVHIIMFVLNKFDELVYRKGAETRNLGDITRVGHLKFTRRRSALVFLSLLPVSNKGGKWDWLHPFLPNDERRQEWERQLESLQSSNEPQSTTPQVSYGIKLTATEAFAAIQNLEVKDAIRKFKLLVQDRS